MHTRPCLSSAARYQARVSGEPEVARPHGSKKPTGGMAPSIERSDSTSGHTATLDFTVVEGALGAVKAEAAPKRR